MTLSFLLGFLACQSDPLLDPAFVPATEDALRVAITPPDRSFRVGEPIPLELVVTAMEGKGRHPVDLTRNSARGRHPTDIWTVRPGRGVADPGVFWQDTAGRLAPLSQPTAVGAPLSTTMEINDWVRFSEPGAYGVQLHTSRVGGYDVSTNAVRLNVIARDPAADEKRTQELVAALDGPGRQDAIRELAWIGSDGTLKLAIDRLSAPVADPDEASWVVLLSMHPDRPSTLAAIDAAIADPARPVWPGLIDARVAVAYNGMHEAAIGEIPDAAKGDPEPEVFRYRAIKNRREGDLADLRAAALARLAEVVTAKRPEARGVALGALADAAWAAEPPAWRDAVLTTLRAELHTLPAPMLGRALDVGWSALADPAAVVGLAAVVRAPGTPAPLRDRALQRLHALDPVAAAPVIEEVVADPGRAVTAACEPVLRSLPSVSEATRQRLVDGIGASDPSTQLRLVATYVGPEHADAVWTAWNAAHADLPTGAMSGYAAYFLRHDPARAEPVLAKYGPDHYWLLLYTAEVLPDPAVLLPRAFQALASAPDQAVYLKGSDYLREYADPTWIPKLMSLLPNPEGNREEAVVTAIMSARGWLVDQKTRNAVLEKVEDRRADMIARSNVVSDDPSMMLKARIDDGVPVLNMNFLEYVGRDAILNKLKQITGSKQVVITYSGTTVEQGQAVFVPLAREAGVPLLVPPGPKVAAPTP